MAGDDENGSRRRRRMDLNLYLGLPHSPHPHTVDLGSSLALSPHLPPPPPAVMLDPPPVVSDTTSAYLLDAPHDPVPPAVASYEHLVPYSPDSPADGTDLGRYLPIPATPDQPSSRSENFRVIGSRLYRAIEAATPDQPSSRAEHFPEMGSRFHRAIEAARRPPLRRFRRSNDLSILDSPSHPPLDERLMHGIMRSQSVLEASQRHRGRAEASAAEESEGEVEEKGKSAANFECNICLDMAKDPVVTGCGHLFCWSCLYQWLHLYCDHSECPVCKGLVDESKVTPIYGRGSSKTTEEEKCGGEHGGIDLQIPPRPHGHRTESWRQQLHGFIPGRMAENDANMHRILDARSSLARLWRMQRGEVRTESGSNAPGLGLPREDMSGHQINSTRSLLRDEILEGFTSRLAAISVDLRGAIRTLCTVTGQAGASTSSTSHRVMESWRPWETTLAADQGSVSSTMAVIQEDIPANDASAEPYSAGSSRSIRQRGWSSTSDSLDVDGGELHSRKRRRLN